MKTAIEVLENFKACPEAIKWAGHKTTRDAWETCHRGNWMLWIASKLGVDKRKSYLCNAEIAYQIIDLMDDKRSVNAVRVAYLYGLGMISIKELEKVRAELTKAREEAGIFFDDTFYNTIADIVRDIAYYAVAYTDKAYLVADCVSIAHAKNFIAYATDPIYSDETYITEKAKSLAKSADICRDILTEEIEKFF
jgi:hypothetical protein